MIGGENLDLIKNANEITVKITSSKSEFIDSLKNKGFHEVEKFTLEDDFFIPREVDVSKMTPREILAKAILVRRCVGNSGDNILLSFKEKNIDENGDIISQKSTNCKVVKRNDAIEFVKSIGYNFLMNIKEKDVVYEDGRLSIAIKDIENGDLLAEMETDENMKISTIEELEKTVEEMNLPIVKGQYFFKKAEIELEKILNK